jgi:hypothetical protein
LILRLPNRFEFSIGSLELTLGSAGFTSRFGTFWRRAMNGLIYLVGLIVVIMFILSALGLR